MKFKIEITLNDKEELYGDGNEAAEAIQEILDAHDVPVTDVQCTDESDD